MQERPTNMPAPVVVTTERDLRLDLFRGIALWLIFLDHIPSNLVAWVTIRNYGFSDATEIFVFVSGYTAAFVYGREMLQRGFVVAGARILRRVWQIVRETARPAPRVPRVRSTRGSILREYSPGWSVLAEPGAGLRWTPTHYQRRKWPQQGPDRAASFV